YAADINDSFAFGPILVRNGVATEIKDTSRHPRTAIGQLDENRYIIVVAEGRLQDAEGLTLTELQNIFLSLGC
ncbi:phosphodiester glycosidase family protein, partial [Acinetobacter baumannii]